MAQCWRKSRQLGVEPGSVTHCPHWASREGVRNERGAAKGEASV